MCHQEGWCHMRGTEALDAVEKCQKRKHHASWSFNMCECTYAAHGSLLLLEEDTSSYPASKWQFTKNARVRKYGRRADLDEIRTYRTYTKSPGDASIDFSERGRERMRFFSWRGIMDATPKPSSLERQFAPYLDRSVSSYQCIWHFFTSALPYLRVSLWHLRRWLLHFAL